MRTITTTLKRRFFADIVDRKKRIEYRDIRPTRPSTGIG
jgi:hypothetical protein